MTSTVTEEEPQALFVELSSPPVLKTQVPPASAGTGLWEVELELGAGVVLRLRRAASC